MKEELINLLKEGVKKVDEVIETLKKEEKEFSEEKDTWNLADCDGAPKPPIHSADWKNIADIKTLIQKVEEDCIGVPKQITPLQVRYDLDTLRVGFESGVKFALSHLNKRAGRL